uniref:NACHT domain-containing protein n=1 Tax=Castor canadensis TaxID=51338 RepID=A0A8C0ZM30_CASCN
MASSARLNFNLLALLEKLSQDELSKFKSLMKAFSLQKELEQIFQAEVTIQAFDKMNRHDLSKKAKDELKGKQKLVHNMSLEKGGISPESFRNGIDPQRRYMKNKLQEMWINNFWPGDSDKVHRATKKYEALVPFFDLNTRKGSLAPTVVLHGPAGVGKTTLMKKLMLDWTEGSLGLSFYHAFYISCKELTNMGPCKFLELVSKDYPALQGEVALIFREALEILIVVDGFDEMRVPVTTMISDICGHVCEEKPVPILLSSLLKRKIVPHATLVVTTRPRVLQELTLLLEQPLFINMEGFLEPDKQVFFQKHFGDEDQALQALEAVKRNEALYSMISAPVVCWVICTCLKLQMERGEDLTLTCQITTSLFLQFLCDQFQPAPDDRPSSHLSAPLEALCLLAAQCLWTQVSVFYEEDLKRLGVKESDLHPFLDKGILQNDSDCMDCYSFMHLSVQQLLAAMFYILKREKKEGRDGSEQDIGDVRKLFSREARRKNPDLAQVGLFLFGLLNRKRAQEVETTFGCQTSMEVKQELLQAKPGENIPFLELVELREVFSCLYESQEEELAEEAMVPFEEMSLQLRNNADLMNSSFCLKHCHNLRRISVQVAKGVFPEDDAEDKGSKKDHYLLPFWMELCSTFDSNMSLCDLDISQAFFNSSSVQILCEKLASATCNFQKVVLKSISPADAYQNLCLAFSGYETLKRLSLQGRDQDDIVPSLCEVLRHPKCNLQYFRLESCSATTQQWADLFLALQLSQSLICLDLTDHELLDEGAKLLCVTLKHPKCFLQRLSLENCHLTEASCKEFSSALIINQRLTHLSLAKNELGDEGVKILCEGLHYPECKLQSLVLWHCNITSDGCEHLSKLLRQESNLTHLDLGLNHVGVTGMRFLCEALKERLCNLKCLWLWGCSITSFSCRDLSEALSKNKKLITLDLGQNSVGFDGIKTLSEVLKLQTCHLQTLRLKIDETDPHIKKLLKEIKESNRQLTIESDHCDSRRKRPSSQDFIF